MNDKKKLGIQIAQMDFQNAVDDRRATKVSSLTYMIGVLAILFSLMPISDPSFRLYFVAGAFIVLGVSKYRIDLMSKEQNKEVNRCYKKLNELIGSELC